MVSPRGSNPEDGMVMSTRAKTLLAKKKKNSSSPVPAPCVTNNEPSTPTSQLVRPSPDCLHRVPQGQQSLRCIDLDPDFDADADAAPKNDDCPTPSLGDHRKTTKKGGLWSLFTSLRDVKVVLDDYESDEKKHRDARIRSPTLSRPRSLRQLMMMETTTGGPSPTRRRLIRTLSASALTSPKGPMAEESPTLARGKKKVPRRGQEEGLDQNYTRKIDRMERRGSITKYNLDESLHRVQKEIDAALDIILTH